MPKKPGKIMQNSRSKHRAEVQEALLDRSQAAIDAFNKSLEIVREAMNRLQEKSK